VQSSSTAHVACAPVGVLVGGSLPHAANAITPIPIQHLIDAEDSVEFRRRMGAERFADVMAARSDAGLVEIVTGDPDDWDPDAIAAATAEIEKRGISPEARQRFAADALDAATAARRPLDRSMKWITILMGGLCLPGVVVIWLYTQYERAGERRKAREMMRYFGYGLAIHFAVLCVVKCAH
jgi:hypothetical protein